MATSPTVGSADPVISKSLATPAQAITRTSPATVNSVTGTETSSGGQVSRSLAPQVSANTVVYNQAIQSTSGNSVTVTSSTNIPPADVVTIYTSPKTVTVSAINQTLNTYKVTNISGGNANTGNIIFDGDNILSTDDVVNIVGNNYAELQSNNTYMWVEDGEADIAVNNNRWIFNNSGNLTLPDIPNPSINYANGQPFSGAPANTGNVTFNDVNIIGDGNLYLQPDPANSGSYLDIFLTSGPDLHLVASASANLILGKDNQSNVMTSWNGNVYIQSWNQNTGTQGGVWTFGGDGSTIFPTQNVQRGDNPSGTITGQTLLFGDNTQEAIISTPDGNSSYVNSQRLVINPGQGYGSGEGGDIYLWAGRGGPTNGSGGDIKIRGGQGMANGTGGYIRIEGGDTQGAAYPGYIDITGGIGENTQGAYVRITGGLGATNGGEAGVYGGYGNDVGGDANIAGGFGGTNQGGNINITGGGSALGLSGYGNVNINAGASHWVFDNTGNLNTAGDIVGPANANLVIYANAGVHSFTFGDDGTFYAPDNVVLGGTSIAIGPGADTLVSDFSNAVMVASSNSEAYIQGIIYNVSDNGSSDWVAQGHRSDDNGGWADMGFTSSGFGDANYTITGQGDGYLFAQSYVNGQAPGGRGGNLVLATGENGTVNDIIFGTGGFLTGNIFGRISDANNALELSRTGASLSVAGNITVSGWLDGANTTFTGSITGNVLTVTNAVDGTIAWGQTLYGNSVIAETVITSQITFSSANPGGNGTYRLNQSQTVSAESMSVNSLYMDGDLKLAADHGIYVRDSHDPYLYDNLIGIAESDATIFVGSINTNGLAIDNNKEYKVDSALNPGTYMAVAKVNAADEVILGSGNSANTLIRVGGDSATTGYGLKLQNGGEGLMPVGLRIGDNTNSGIFGAPLEVSSRLQGAANNQSSPAGASFTSYRGTGTVIANDEWGSYLYGSRLRGTINAPLPTKNGDWLMEFGATSFDGTNNNGGGEIAFRVAGTVTSSSNPSNIEFYNTVTGSNNQSLGMVLDSSQNLSVTGNVRGANLLGPLANGNSNVNIASANGNITVTSSGTNTWTFDTTGNLTAPGNIIGIFANGNSSISIPSANGNINISAAGGTNELVITSTGVNVAGTFNATGNANVNNIGATQAIITTSANIPIVQNGNSNVTITSGANVSVFTAGNATAQFVVTSTGANIPGTANIVGNVNVGNLIGPHANGNSNINMPAANGNINLSVAGTANVLVVTGTGANINGNLAVANGNITGNTGGFAIGYLNIPQVSASNTTLALTDAGKHYYSTSAGNFTLTVPNNTSVSFATGTAISIVVQSAGNVLVNAASGVTLYMAGNSTAANRVVSNYGMATLMKVATDTWMINGTGVA